MKIDDVLHRLRRIPRPIWSAAAMPRLSSRPAREKRTPLGLKLYWLVVAFVSAPLLNTTIGWIAVALVGAVFAFPAFGAAIIAPLAGDFASRDTFTNRA